MYDRTIPIFNHGLTALSRILSKGEAYCEARRIDPAVMLGMRLFPDMFPLTRQVQIATDHARRAPARLAGIEAPSVADTETSFAELIDRIAATQAFLTTITPAALEEAETRTINLKAGQRDLSFPGATYLAGFAMPNFFFHMTTAYNILRNNGVELGKVDFLGG
jgi:hypothetical protein